MDANGLRFWMLSESAHWTLLPGAGGAPGGAAYDGEGRVLRLASRRPVTSDPGPGAAAEAEALARLALVAQAEDAFGTRAWWDADAGEVRATGAAGGMVPIFAAAGVPVTDIAVGYDGVLYAAADGGVVMRDLRDRWDRVLLRDAALAAWRLAPNPAGGVWVLDREAPALWRVLGIPFPARPYAPYAPTTVRPCSENPDPPRLARAGRTVLPAGERAIAIATGPDGRLAVLAWGEGGEARLRLLGDDGTLGPALVLRGARYAYDIAWTGATTVAVLVARRPREALVYRVDEGGRAADPVGDLYPLRGHTGEPFVNGTTFPATYPLAADASADGGVPTTTAPVLPVSRPALARSGLATASAPLDSGSAQTVWHRLYVEAALPPLTGVRLWLAATNEAAPPAGDEEWHEHRFGELFAAQPAARGHELPRGAWLSHPSELPYGRGLLRCAPERDRAGLFTVLVQRTNRRVRALRGRYLWVRAELLGDGRATPEIAAVRAYGSRFSYRDRYLPELYHEQELGADAERVIPVAERHTSTPADFLERFLAGFEGMLTPLEDRIAASWLLTDARTVPDGSLEWLASWIGLAFEPGYPAERRRALLAAAPQLAREHGTLRGLVHALDVATAGACSGGEIVVVENFRLRRTFATILGIDLADETDPLLGGLVASGNSYVGDTLFLGDEQKREVLALFGPAATTSAAERAAVAALFDDFAFRVSVLVHQNVTPQSLALVERVAAAATPAHVQLKVLPTSSPLLVGIASLVGVDTYLGPTRERTPVRVDESLVGARDFLLRAPSLDPRLAGGVGTTHREALVVPVAAAGAPATEYGTPIPLDASASRADAGSEIERYRWTLLR